MLDVWRCLLPVLSRLGHKYQQFSCTRRYCKKKNNSDVTFSKAAAGFFICISWVLHRFPVPCATSATWAGIFSVGCLPPHQGFPKETGADAVRNAVQHVAYASGC